MNMNTNEQKREYMKIKRLIYKGLKILGERYRMGLKGKMVAPPRLELGTYRL